MKFELVIGTLLTILSVVIALQGYQLNKKKHQEDQTEKQTKEEKDDAKESAEIKLQLGYISKGVDEIRLEFKDSQRQMVALGERVTRVEESSKQAHKRLDNLEIKGEM